MSDKKDNQLNESFVDNRCKSEVNVSSKCDQICTTFDDISLCDNSANDDMVDRNSEVIIGSNEESTHICDSNEDKLSIDSVPNETPNNGSNNEEEEELIYRYLNDLDIVQEMKTKNGIKFKKQKKDSTR